MPKPKHDWTLVHIFYGDRKQEILDYISNVQDAKIVNTGVVFDNAILVDGGNKRIWKQLTKEYNVEIIPDLVC